ncbi:MAG: hypothetical protein AABX71_00365 [Nanoarchaeota archaeon]
MVEKDLVFTGKVKQKGIFAFKELYKFCYVWLVDKEYWVVEKGYTEKIGAEGKDIEVHWEATRKISDYFRFYLKIDWMILGMKNVEVEKNGVKVGMNKGYPEIKITAILEKDYEHRWENKAVLKFLRGLYDRYIIRARIEKYEDQIHEEGDEFLAQVKSFLAIEGTR